MLIKLNARNIVNTDYIHYAKIKKDAINNKFYVYIMFTDNSNYSSDHLSIEFKNEKDAEACLNKLL